MVRNESRVVIKGPISLPPETVENGQQTSMFFVDTRPNEINDRDMMPRLASRTKAMAEHEPQGRLKHGLVGLLQAGFFIEGEDFMAEASFLSALARKRSICAQSTLCGLSFFMRHQRAKPAYCARRFPGRHPSERGATRIPSALEPCS